MRRPADMAEAASLRHAEDTGGCFAAGGSPEGVEMTAGHFVETSIDAAEFFADAGLVEGIGFSALEGDVSDAAVGEIAAEVEMAPRVGAELVAVGDERAPEGGPGEVEGGVATFRFFVGQEERGFDLVLPEDGGDLLGRFHVAGVDREKQGTRAGGGQLSGEKESGGKLFHRKVCRGPWAER